MLSDERVDLFRMRTLPFLILLTAMANAADIEGRWRPLALRQDGMGSVLEFKPNGVVWVRTGLVHESVYAVEGQELIQPGRSPGSAPTRHVIDLREEGILRIWLGQKLLSESRRIGPAQEGILGEWLHEFEIKGYKYSIRHFYWPDGKTFMVMPRESYSGTWKKQKDSISIYLPKAKPLVGAYTVSDEKLVLPGGREYLRY